LVLIAVLALAVAALPSTAFATGSPGVSMGAPTNAPTHSASDGVEWGDAALGAAFTPVLLSLASATVLLVGRRRRPTPTS
jgi:hypothetical protein